METLALIMASVFLFLPLTFGLLYLWSAALYWIYREKLNTDPTDHPEYI
jgi:hypothetical protein